VRLWTNELFARVLRRVLVLVVSALAVSVFGGCVSSKVAAPTLPQKHTVLRGQLVIHSDFPLAAEHRLLEDLTARRRDLTQQLALPTSDEPINVYLFETTERFHDFMQLYHPEFPERRAFFVETDTRLIVYVHWADQVAEDLYHETTHAYLHSIVPQLPLWLDEGLAEAFEVPRANAGINRSHLELLAARLERGEWQPDLKRIEQLQSPFDMDQEDYAESWAWAHFLLHGGLVHRELLQDYLGQLRHDAVTEPVSIRLERTLGDPEAALIEHIRRLAAGELQQRPKSSVPVFLEPPGMSPVARL
jgi:hypothetical protein